MPDDNDTKALRIAGDALFLMEVKCREAGFDERLAMEEERDRLWEAYEAARENLIASGVIVGDQELAELTALTEELDRAAQTNAVAQTALKLVGFFARIAAA